MNIVATMPTILPIQKGGSNVMNRFGKRWAASVTAGVALNAVPASAVHVDASGVGQVLLYPYYTVREAEGRGYNTLFSVVNHTREVKALRLRFREAMRGAPVQDLNLYLGPYDIWAGALLANSQGTTLKTEDRSCTWPPVPAEGIAFVNYGYTDLWSDGSSSSLDRTREGYFEIIEMGVVTQPTTAAYATQQGSWARAAIPEAVPLARDVAFNCRALADLEIAAALSSHLSPPTGGLSGTATLVSVFDGTDYSMNALALGAFSDRVLWQGAGYLLPDLTQASPRVSEILGSSQGSGGANYVRTEWPEEESMPADPVSAVLLVDSIQNEYVVDPDSQAAQTDWVVTFPTKQHYYRRTEYPDYGVRWEVQGLFASPYIDGAIDRIEDCGNQRTFDREGGQRNFLVYSSTSCGLFPPPMYTRWASNVITFDGANLLRSAVSLHAGGLSTGMTSGWRQLAWERGSGTWSYYGPTHFLLGGTTLRVGLDGTASVGPRPGYFGLPAIGFALHRYSYGAMPTATGSVLANYGGLFPHKGVQLIK
ncbi:MAG: hypothetical protein F9K47_10720 [Burkholderiales bacterium]|nr:MAG: hypothetical protein F9K47_10720 [Burkholderiales bacterium]